MKSKQFFFILPILLLLIFIQYVYSVSYSDFTTPRTCNQTWNGDCSSTTLNDAFDNPSPCNGTQYCAGTCGEYVEEVYLNASAVRPGEAINATCQFSEVDQLGDDVYEYIFYYNSSGWVEVYSINAAPEADASVNRSVVFRVNSTEGEHIVRCSIQYSSSVVSDEYCVKNTIRDHDNDDVNFTVVIPLEYDFWNITNYTTGGNITSGQTYTRNDTINVSAHWTKALNASLIEINGTGSFTNYTVPIAGNWTNFTINLTNTTRYNQYNISINAIYANDSTEVWGSNNTSPLLFFYLSAENDPNVTNFWFNYTGITTNDTNRYTNLTIFANVSDDVGLSTVIANVTYPNNDSVNVTMAGSTSTGWQTWNYTFGGSNLDLNVTGNYTVWIYARDIGDQEKASGIDSSTENMTFYVNDTYTLNLTPAYSSSNTTYNRGEAIRVDVLDVNGLSVETLNWTINITRFNKSKVIEYDQQNATYYFHPNTTDPVGNYTLSANVSKDNNTGNATWEFNVSNILYLNFSQPATNTQYGANGIIDTPTVNIYNVRNQTLNYTVNATLQCQNGNFNLSLSGQIYNSSSTCRASTSSGVTFQITANASDVYNNSGEVDLSLTTQSSGGGSTTGGGGGGGGGVVVQNVTIINVTTNTTGFNFTLTPIENQIYRGEDATILGTLSNEGTTNLTISSSIFLNSTCCDISMDPSEFTLEVGGSEVPFTISIHVNISTEPETEHFADITLKSGTLEKSKRIKIIVEENPVISSLDQVTGQISEVESKIMEYAKAGIDVGFLQNLLNRIKGTKTDSTSAMEGDDINQLKQQNDFIQSSLNKINDELNKLAFLKLIYENKWNIVTGLTIGLISTYLVTLIVIPYFRIEFEIRKLILERASLKKSRVVTTKSFFLRKIDDRTFRSIITDRQGKIYKLKSMIELKQQAKSNLIHERLNPLYAGKLIREKIAKMRSKKKQNT